MLFDRFDRYRGCWTQCQTRTQAVVPCFSTSELHRPSSSSTTAVTKRSRAPREEHLTLHATKEEGQRHGKHSLVLFREWVSGTMPQAAEKQVVHPEDPL